MGRIHIVKKIIGGDKLNIKSVKRKLQEAHRSFISSIENAEISKIMNEKSFITGGAIVSLLQDEEPNDLDYYFTDKESCLKVTQYYVSQFNSQNNNLLNVQVKETEGRVSIYVPSMGIAKNKYRKGYKPVFLSSNAITLSEDVQLVIRFYGDPSEIHENYDYIHCTSYYRPFTNELVLPQKALESLITKELKYVGSKYPLASIIRARKFIERGWTINAGQYLKMILQCGKLDLNDPVVLEEQLTGVDLTLFRIVIEAIKQRKEVEPDFDFSLEWVSDVVDKVFDEEDMDEFIHSNEDETEDEDSLFPI